MRREKKRKLKLYSGELLRKKKRIADDYVLSDEDE
jgi:hypothetical protein